MRNTLLSATFLLLLVSATANAQRVAGNCWVHGSFYDTREKLGSGVLLLGKFKTAPNKDVAIKTFPAYTDLIVTVNLHYDFVFTNLKPRPDGIRAAIVVSNHAETNILDSMEASAATTALRDRWNLMVEKKITFENRRYTFKVGCADAVKPVKRLN